MNKWKTEHVAYAELEKLLNTRSQEGWSVHSIGHNNPVEQMQHLPPGGGLIAVLPALLPGCVVVFQLELTAAWRKTLDTLSETP